MKKILLTFGALASSTAAMAADPVYNTQWSELHEWIDKHTPTILSEHFSDSEYDESLCLAINIYHEARSSTYYDMSSTAHVVLNRVKAKGFRDTICGVVWQPKQFSWTWDGKSDKPYETEAWLFSQFVTFMVLKDYSSDNTYGSDHYHTTKVNPKWTKHGYDKRVIGAHVYMKMRHPIIPKK